MGPNEVQLDFSKVTELKKIGSNKIKIPQHPNSSTIIKMQKSEKFVDTK